jgi:V8-like Glu-specific endopeptidase
MKHKRQLSMLALGAVLVAVPVVGTQAAQAAADPCRDRAPTVLDQRSDWRCVGLATFAPDGTEPVERKLTADEIRRLGEPRPASAELGVAVSPDGRLYRQTRPSPPGPAEVRSYNPSPPDVEPEGEARKRTTMRTNLVLGADNRVLRTATKSYPWRVMGSVMKPGGATTSNCSGSLIGPRHFLTAGHCMHQGGTGKYAGWLKNRKIAPGQKGIGVFPNGVKNHAWYFAPSGWFDDGDPAYDYGMIVLEDRDDTAHLGWLGWRSSNQTGGHWTFGYPGFSLNCAASPSSDGKCNNFLYGDDNDLAYPIVGKMLATEADSQPGQSGSPIYKYNNGDRRVIAVLAYEDPDDEVNWGTRVTSDRSSNFCDWIHTFPSAFNNHPCE